jgi:hypothetical protein
LDFYSIAWKHAQLQGIWLASHVASPLKRGKRGGGHVYWAWVIKIFDVVYMLACLSWSFLVTSEPLPSYLFKAFNHNSLLSAFCLMQGYACSLCVCVCVWAEVNAFAVKWPIMLCSLLMMYIYQRTNHMDQFKLAWLAPCQRCRSCWFFELLHSQTNEWKFQGFSNVGDMACIMYHVCMISNNNKKKIVPLNQGK